MKNLLLHRKNNLFATLFIALMLLSPNLVQADVDITKTDVTACGADDGTAKVVVTDGTPPYTYEWSNGETSDSISELEKGDYTVTVTDANDCTGEGRITIEGPESDLSVSINGDGRFIVVCDNFSEVTLTAIGSGGTPEYTYNWPDEGLTVSATGDYTAIVTDSLGCTEESSTFVWFIRTPCSVDPNDIIGPDGYDSERWVSINDELSYTIRFENDPDFATAPAQKVVVTYPVDDNVDIFSLKLSNFGFGDYNFQVPPNTTFYSERLDVRDSLGIYVDVVAGIDVTQHEAFWIFESLDPSTGLPPSDPSIGFLLVNDSITRRGEGFVSFTVEPKSTSQTGDSIYAEASIVFDFNDAIETNLWTNIVDALPPASIADPLPEILANPTFDVSWQGQDDIGGSGLATYALYYHENGGPLNLYEDQIPYTELSTEFSGNSGSSYEIFTIATDNVGNVEAFKDSADIMVTIDQFKLVQPNLNTSVCVGESLLISWEISDTGHLNITIEDSAGNTSIIESDVDIASNSFTWDIPTSFESGNYVIHIADIMIGGRSDSSSIIAINGLPDAEAGMNVVICQGEEIQLSASGGMSYLWTPADYISNVIVQEPVVNPQSSTTYSVKVTDNNFCSAYDSVMVSVIPTIVPVIILEVSCNPADTGTVVQNFFTADGCDSMITTITTILESYDIAISESSCNPLDTGTVVNNLTSVDGCDSVITTITSLQEGYDISLFELSCNPADTGTIIENLTTEDGCDSIVTTQTSLYEGYDISLSELSCNPADTGTIVENLTSDDGCDSIVTTITSLNIYASVVYMSSCNPADTGTTVETLTASDGCDSIAYTVISLGDGYDIMLFELSCNPADTGTVVENLTSTDGCDSIVTAVTTLIEGYEIMLFESSCNPIDTGTIVENLTTSDGCDSVVTTSTSLNEAYEVDIFESSCNPVDTGTIVENLTTAEGCDSIVTTVTSFIDGYEIDLFESSCNPADTGTVIENLTAADGCDSIITTVISLIEGYEVNLFEFSCNPADTGTVVENLTTSDGCDSIISTITNLLPNFDLFISESSCDPADTGTVVNNLTTIMGCDSIVTITTQLIPPYDILIENESCLPEDTGTVIATLTSSLGCDSIVTTITSLAPGYVYELNDTIADGESVIVDGAEYDSTGVYTIDGLIASDGCDSTVILNLVVISGFGLPSSISTLEIYPNPFTEITHIKYRLNEQAMLRIELFDIRGKSYGLLVNEMQAPGNYEYDVRAAHLSRGVYEVRLSAGTKSVSRRVVLVR